MDARFNLLAQGRADVKGLQPILAPSPKSARFSADFEVLCDDLADPGPIWLSCFDSCRHVCDHPTK
jgi:hypothetical protein